MSYIDDAFLQMDDRGRSRFERCWEKHLKESPPGSLNLPPLLEQRRMEHKLAAGFFDYACLFDHVMVAQIDYDVGMDKLFSGSKLVRPQAYQEADKRRSYVGVLVSAGCTALDKLASEGVQLGHIVRFMRYTPFQCKVDEMTSDVPGESYEVFGVDLVVTDIRASFDLGIALREGKVSREVFVHDNGAREFVYCDENGDIWHPEQVQLQENFS